MSIAGGQDYAAPYRRGKALGDSDPITVPKMDVEQHRVRSQLAGKRQSLDRGVCLRDDTKGSSSQDHAGRLATRRVIINDKDGPNHRPSLPHAPACVYPANPRIDSKGSSPTQRHLAERQVGFSQLEARGLKQYEHQAIVDA